MIKMHRYDDGHTGLAAFCDTCGKQIRQHGYVVWNHDPDTDAVSEWRVIHQADCDDLAYDSSMPLEAEIIYLANSAGVDLEQAIKTVLTLDALG